MTARSPLDSAKLTQIVLGVHLNVSQAIPSAHLSCSKANDTASSVDLFDWRTA